MSASIANAPRCRWATSNDARTHPSASPAPCASEFHFLLWWSCTSILLRDLTAKIRVPRPISQGDRRSPLHFLRLFAVKVSPTEAYVTLCLLRQNFFHPLDDVGRLHHDFFCDRFQFLPGHRFDFPVSLLRFRFELRIVETFHQRFTQDRQTICRHARWGDQRAADRIRRHEYHGQSSRHLRRFTFVQNFVDRRHIG